MITDLSAFPVPWDKKYKENETSQFNEEAYLSDIERWEEDFKTNLLAMRANAIQKQKETIGDEYMVLRGCILTIDQILGVQIQSQENQKETEK
jgi:hypothetical protein